ncbi:MAG: HYR domain-containing protein [Flavobacteriales bacterium]|nr:HYR domain-containing protein [Flavobacteriales bacterium]
MEKRIGEPSTNARLVVLGWRQLERCNNSIDLEQHLRNQRLLLPIKARYLRITRHSSSTYSAFHLDAARFLNASVTGGVWSGGPHVTSAGIFTIGPAGNFPVTYTVIGGGCTYTYTSSITVAPSPGGGSIAGGGTVCPGSSGTLNLSGHSGSIVRWQWTEDGVIWNNTTETSPTFIWSGLTAPRRFRVELSAPTCPNGYSEAIQVTPEDPLPPVLICPPESPLINVDADADCNLQVPDFTGLFVATDNCSTTLTMVQSPTAGTVIPFSPMTPIAVRAVDDAGNVSATCFARLVGADNTPPLAQCPPDTTLAITIDACIAEYAPPEATYSDNCMGSGTAARTYLRHGNQPVAQFAVFNTSGWSDVTGESSIGFPPGEYTLVNVIHHGADVIAICGHVVTVVDGLPPVADCPPAYTLLHALPNECHATYEVPAISSTDNCSGAGVPSGPVLSNSTGIVVVAGSVVVVAPEEALPVGTELLLPVGTHQFTDTITDGAGNQTICTWQVEVIDASSPVFDNCPGAITVNTDPNSCEHLYTFPIIESTDNCDGDTESDYRAFILEAGNINWHEVTGQVTHPFAPGLHQLMEIHQDDSGNQDTCAWSLNVLDGNAPSITCPTIIAQLNVGAGCTVALPDYSTSATAIGNCSGNAGLVVSQSPAAGALRGLGSHTITLIATQAGQSASCSFVVSIVDNTPPSFNNCPTNITVNAAPNACSATVTWNPPTVSDNCTGVAISQTAGPAPGSTFALGAHIITYTALDAANNPATCSFIITVVDAAVPTITCVADIAIEATPGLCGAVVNYTLPAASDNCGTVSVARINGLPSGSVFPVGTTLVRHRASDTAVPPNTSDCTFWVTVFDASAPVFSSCSNITVNSSSTNCSAVVSYAAPTVAEPCTTCSPAGTPAGYSALGTYQGRTYYYRNTTSNWLTANNAAIAAGGHLAVIRDAAMNSWLRSAVDAAGGTNQSFWIGLNDVTTDGTWRWTNSASVGYLNWDAGEPNNLGGNEDYALVKGNGMWNDEKTSTSLRSVVEVEASCITPVLTSQASTASGQSFPVGTTAVSFQSTDPAGNTSTCTFNVEVTDTTNPSFGAIPSMLGFVPANGCTITAPSYPTPTDNCPGATVEYVSGPNPGDALAPGSYQMHFKARDAAGLVSAVQTMSITVQDTVKPTIIDCPTNLTVSTTPGQCTGVASWTAPSISDNCTGAVIAQTAGPAINSVLGVGTYSVTYTATDAYSNTSSCSFSISVVDSEPAEITCPNDTTLYPHPGTCAATFGYDAPVITDNCGGPWSALFIGGLPPGDFPVGATTTQYTGSVAGQTLTCEFTVTVLDVEPPSVYCPLYDSIQYFLNANCELAWPNLLDSIIVSDCSSVTPVMWPPADTIITQPGVYSMTMDFIDAYGNLRENDHLIWVRDTIRPAIMCPANISVSADAGSCGAVVNYVAPVGADNCGVANTIRTAGLASGSFFPMGNTTVTYQVTDAAGLTASCSFIVTVTDNIAPIISGCPANLIVTASPGACNATASWMAPSVTDNCAGTTISQTAGLTSGSSFPIGTTTITYTASDGVNTSTCSFDVLVQATVVDIAYAITSICQGSAPILPSIASPAGGVFSDANQAGTIDQFTGAFDPALATPGLHTLGYVFAGDCTSHDWFTVNVVAAPSASIAYAGSPYCENENVATMTRAGTVGGTYTATPSLSGLSPPQATWTSAPTALGRTR